MYDQTKNKQETNYLKTFRPAKAEEGLSYRRLRLGKLGRLGKVRRVGRPT